MAIISDHTRKNITGDSFLKGTFILALAGIVVKVIGSLNWIFVSRVLGGEGIGLYQMAFPIYLLALSISSAGIPVAISIITAEKLAVKDIFGAKRVFRISLTLLAITGLLFSLLTYFGAGLLVEYKFIRDPRAYYSVAALAPAIFFVTILSSYRGYLQGWQRMTPTAVSQIAEQIFRVVTMIVFATLLMPKGLEFAAGGASLGAFAGSVAGLAVLIYYYWRLEAEIKQQTGPLASPVSVEPVGGIMKRIFKLALPVSASSIMLPLVANLDLLIVPARLEAAGYSVEQATELFGYLTGMAVPLINLATILTASLATSLVPAIAEAQARGDRLTVFQRTAAAMRIANLITFPAFMLIFLLDAPISQMIYNAPNAGPAIGVMSTAIVLLGIHQVTTGVLQGLGHTAIPVINMGLAAVVKVLLNWTLTAMPELGIKGAAWATVADIGVAAVMNMYFVNKFVGYHFVLADITKTLAATVVMGAAVYAAYDKMLLLLGSNTFAALIAIVTGIVVYGLVLLFTGGVNERDISRIPVAGPVLLKILHSAGRLK